LLSLTSLLSVSLSSAFSCLFSFLSCSRSPPPLTLFPYTTLFRSNGLCERKRVCSSSDGWSTLYFRVVATIKSYGRSNRIHYFTCRSWNVSTRQCRGHRGP